MRERRTITLIAALFVLVIGTTSFYLFLAGETPPARRPELILWIIVSLNTTLAVGLRVWVPFAAISFLAIMFVRGSLNVLVPRELAACHASETDIHRAARNGLRGGMTLALIFGVVGGLLGGWPEIWLSGPSFRWPSNFHIITLSMGVSTGFIVGIFRYGGTALIRRAWLRTLLALSGCLPLRLFPFLEEMRERELLRRIGGAYVFAHDFLLHRFAEMRSSNS